MDAGARGVGDHEIVDHEPLSVEESREGDVVENVVGHDDKVSGLQEALDRSHELGVEASKVSPRGGVEGVGEVAFVVAPQAEPRKLKLKQTQEVSRPRGRSQREDLEPVRGNDDRDDGPATLVVLEYHGVGGEAPADGLEAHRPRHLERGKFPILGP